MVPLKNNEYLLHNTLSQKSILLNKYEASTLEENGKIEALLRLRLQSIGALIGSEINEIERLHATDIRQKKLEEKSLNLTLMMTEACNFGCGYCNQGIEKSNNFIGEEVFKSVLKYINLNKKIPKVSINWYGGEPLIRKHDLIKYSKLIKDKCLSLNKEYTSDIITNGYFLDSRTANDLVSSGVTCAQVTIDGNRKDHDNSRYIKLGMSTFDKIMDNISSVLKESDLKIVIRVNVNKRNESGLEELINYFDKRDFSQSGKFAMYFANIYSPSKNNIDKHGVNPADANILDPVEFASIQYNLNNLCWNKSIPVALDMPSYQGNCIATKKSSYAVSPDGTLHKCYIVMANENESIGKITTSGEIDLDIKKFESWDKWSAFEQNECSNCKLIGSCRGGCPLDYIKKNETIEGGRCPSAKLYFNEYIFHSSVVQGLVKPDQWDDTKSKTNLQNLKINSNK
jgi:uncharacterized protein